MQYVYILLCADGKPYVCCTSDLKERIQGHVKRQVPATRFKLPVILVFYCAFNNKYKAYEFEKYLKAGSGRAFTKKRLI
jgi:putative endonuclease